MRRFLKAVFSLTLTLSMVLSISSVACWAESVTVEGVIGDVSVALDSFQIIYHANGGTGSHAGELVLAGESTTVSYFAETGITRDGHTFCGWNTESDGSGTDHVEGNAVILHDHLILYAQWTPSSEEPTASGDDSPTDSTGTTPAAASPAAGAGSSGSGNSTGSGSGSGSAAKTGDSGIAKWVSLLSVSITVMVCIVFLYNRDKKRSTFQES